MSRKDYKAIAAVINKVVSDNSQDEGKPDLLVSITQGIADYMASDNPLFNRGKFLKACGVMA